MQIFRTVASNLDNCLFVPQKWETCFVINSWKGLGHDCRAHRKPSQNTRLNRSVQSIFRLWSSALACRRPQLVYRVALMDDVTLRPSMCIRTGSDGYVVLLNGPVCNLVNRHSCASLSAMTLSCSVIVREEYAVMVSAWPTTCAFYFSFHYLYEICATPRINCETRWVVLDESKMWRIFNSFALRGDFLKLLVP